METEKICDHPKGKGKEKSGEHQRTIRFALELKESNDKYFPEFSFKELVRSAAVGEVKEKELPVDGDGDDDKLQALAKKFEEKYGPKQKPKKKRRERIQDLVDVTYGYDETDPFVDNSEAYDELIPADWTTEHGGFYINQGGLNFKPISSDESDSEDFKGIKKRKTPKKLKDPNKVKKVKDAGDRKRKHLTTDKEKKPRKIRLISGDKEKKHKKKLNLGGPASTTNTSSSVLLKMISSASTTTTTSAAVVSTSQVTSPSSLSSVSLASVGTATPALSTEGSPQEKQSTIKTEVSDENQNAKGTENSILSQDANVTAPSNGSAVVNQNGLSPDFVPKLPSYLPLTVEACVQKLKLAANNAADEGKCKFFNKDVNQLLLEIEIKSRELSCRVRSGIYDYLAFYLPCTKETLLKRAKKLLLTDQAGRLREPMAKLKAAINKVMPEQIKAFEEEVRQHVEEQSKTSGVEEQSPEDKKKELFKSAMEVDEDVEKPDEATTPTNPSTPSIEEKTKKALPKRKFVWTNEIRELLSDVVTLRVKLFEMSKTRTTSAEEYLKEFFETEVKPLWPKGWMTSRVLFKESKSVHTRVTSAQFKPKKVPGPKKQGESLSLGDVMDNSSQQSEIKEEPKTPTINTAPSINTTTVNSTVTNNISTITKITNPVIVKQEHGTMTTTAAAVMSGATKTLPKLNAGALSMLKAKIIQVNYPGVLGKTNLLTQAGTKPVSALILSTKSTTNNTLVTTTSTPVSMVTMPAKSSLPVGLSTPVSMVTMPATVSMVTMPAKSSLPVGSSYPVSMVTMPANSSLPVGLSTPVSMVTMPAKSSLPVGLSISKPAVSLPASNPPMTVSNIAMTTKPSVSMVTTLSTPVSLTTNAPKPVVVNRLSVESRGAVTKGESTVDKRLEQRVDRFMTSNGLQQQQLQQQQQQQQQHQQQQQQHEQQHQPINSPASSLGQLSNMTGSFTSVQQFHQQPIQTKPQYHQSVTVSSTPNNQAMKSQPVTILDFADMMLSSESHDDPTQEMNPLQPSQFITKSPSPQKTKDKPMSVSSKVGTSVVVSPQRPQNTVYTSPSSMLRSPSQMTQARNSISQSNVALANMLMGIANPSMSNLQNKFIDLNAASIMNQQRQQAANNKTILDSITSPSRMTMDMHSSSVPLSHPMISRQLSNPIQTGSVFNSLQQPTLSMLGHTTLPKNTNPLSHLGMVPDTVPSTLMHMNRPLQQQQQQQPQQQSTIVIPPNPFNQDPNHNPTGGHPPPSSFMPRFS